MIEIGTLINSLCHIGFLVYILSSIAEIKQILRSMQSKLDRITEEIRK